MRNKSFLIILVIIAFVVTIITASIGLYIVETNPDKFRVQIKPSAIIEKPIK